MYRSQIQKVECSSIALNKAYKTGCSQYLKILLVLHVTSTRVWNKNL